MQPSISTSLPAHYFPFASGRYSTAPNLNKFPADFGNGRADHRIFQIDTHWRAYIQNKKLCRKEGISKYYKIHQLKENTARQISTFIISRLLSEYPSVFKIERQSNYLYFTNQLSQEAIRFDHNYGLADNSKYVSTLDALASQVQEDMAIWQMDGTGDWMSMIHLCAPNHWSPANKIGNPFSIVHQPVAGMEKMRQRYQPMLKTLIKGGSFVRFAWGLATDTCLNHHPEPPLNSDTEIWRGRNFDPENPSLYVRIERQTLSGFPEADAVFFTIRTYFEEVKSLSSGHLQSLNDALKSMPPESLAYKGLKDDNMAIQAYLQQLIRNIKQ